MNENARPISCLVQPVTFSSSVSRVLRLLLSRKATTYSGYGNLSWAIPATATVGSGYTIKVTNLVDTTKTLESSSFTIAAS